MKQPVQFFQWKPFFVMLFLSLLSLAIWGQEEGSGGTGGGGGESSTTTTTTTRSTNVSITSDSADTWYTSPWVWIVGAAVFILLLVALLSNRGRDTVRTSDTVRVERDRGTNT